MASEAAGSWPRLAPAPWAIMRGMKLRRFSLRMLFIAVALAAIASWASWKAWPLWVEWREQKDFESSTRQIKAGMTRNQWSNLVAWNSSARPASLRWDAQHVRIGLAWVVWENAIYCIFYRMGTTIPGNDYDAPCSSIEVFRLSPVPTSYQPFSSNGKIMMGSPLAKKFPNDMFLAYLADFQEFLSGDRKESHGFNYELIYSDPPQ